MNIVIRLNLSDFSGFSDLLCLLAGEAIDPKTILSIPCDVLVPAAIGNVIDAATAEHIDAKYVVEAANGPTTPEGDAVLRKRGITVLPDIYTNGGVCSDLSASTCSPVRPIHIGSRREQSRQCRGYSSSRTH